CFVLVPIRMDLTGDLGRQPVGETFHGTPRDRSKNLADILPGESPAGRGDWLGASVRFSPGPRIPSRRVVWLTVATLGSCPRGRRRTRSRLRARGLTSVDARPTRMLLRLHAATVSLPPA